MAKSTLGGDFAREQDLLFWKICALASDRHALLPGDDDMEMVDLRRDFGKLAIKLAHSYSVDRASVEPFGPPDKRKMEVAWVGVLAQAASFASIDLEPSLVNRVLAEAVNCLIRYEGFKWKSRVTENEPIDLLASFCRESAEERRDFDQMLATFRETLLPLIDYVGESDSTVFDVGKSFKERHSGSSVSALGLHW